MANTITFELDLDELKAKQGLKKFEGKATKAGNKAGNNFSKGFSKSLNIAAKLTAIAGTLASALTFKEAISSAIRQEDAINKLNTALQITGKFSTQASEDLQTFASSLQQVTKYGDEAILETQALIQSLGDLSQGELKDATKATLDLAAALNIDLRSAATLVGKAAAGEVGSFSRYGVSIKKAETNAQTFANALEALQSKFGGAAEKQVNTFSGATQQLSNTFGDLLEEIGFLITKQPLLVEAIKGLEKTFKDAGISVKAFAKDFSLFQSVISPILNFNKIIIDNVISPLELLGNVSNVISLKVIEGFQAMIASLGMLGGKIGEFLSFLGIEAGEGLKNFAESSREVFNESAQNSQEAFNSVFEFPFADKLSKANEQVREGMGMINSTIKESTDAAGGDFEDLTKKVSKTTDSANKIINASLVKGISGGIQEMVKSFSSADNALENFANFLLKTFGDLAIQLGEFYIATGLANLALITVDPTAQIATGAALVALGSILGSFASGANGGAGGDTGSTGGSIAESTEAIDDPENFRERQTASEITINVQGSLVQQEELGSFIQTTLNEVNEKNGIIQVNTRQA